MPLLKDRKTIKLMAKQDRMALAAAAGALRRAELSESDRRDRTGVYAAVGALAFDEEELQMLAGLCIDDGRVDAFRSAAHVYHAMNPLTTFKCLPNMAVFHISVNLNEWGPISSLPGYRQWHSALLRAWHDRRRRHRFLLAAWRGARMQPAGALSLTGFMAQTVRLRSTRGFRAPACDRRRSSLKPRFRSIATYGPGIVAAEPPSAMEPAVHCGPSARFSSVWLKRQVMVARLNISVKPGTAFRAASRTILTMSGPKQARQGAALR